MLGPCLGGSRDGSPTGAGIMWGPCLGGSRDGSPTGVGIMLGPCLGGRRDGSPTVGAGWRGQLMRQENSPHDTIVPRMSAWYIERNSLIVKSAGAKEYYEL